MNDSKNVAILSEHLSWARGLAIFWIIMSFAIFGAAFGLIEYLEIASELRPIVFVILGTLLVVNAIWQATGLALARMERVILPRMQNP